MIYVNSINVTPSYTTLRLGASFFPNVTIFPSDATDKSVGWSSDDPNIASVNPDSGLVYANTIGTTTIYATACDGSGVRGNCTVRVIPIYVQDIEVFPETLTLAIGDRECLDADIYPSNATNPNVSWTSSNSAIAEVDSNGCVTAKAVGTAYIHANAADGNGAHGCCEVSVHTSIKDNVEYHLLCNQCKSQ